MIEAPNFFSEELLAAGLPCSLGWAGWILCAALCVACDSTSHAPLHQVYIWQRAWTPEVGRAMDELRQSVSGWHVLVAESDTLGRWSVFVPMLTDPREAGKGMTAVVRIDGSRLLADSGWLAGRLKGSLDSQPAGRHPVQDGLVRTWQLRAILRLETEVIDEIGESPCY